MGSSLAQRPHSSLNIPSQGLFTPLRSAACDLGDPSFQGTGKRTIEGPLTLDLDLQKSLTSEAQDLPNTWGSKFF